jgi:uncharacterized membrane protein YjjP (DUF1212 family)
MSNLFQEITDDIDFIKSHTLQPQWFKIFKVFLLVGTLAGYYFLFGLIKSLVFFVIFLLLMLIVHLIYRKQTNKFQKNWLDFVIEGTANSPKSRSIGKYYYASVIFNALIALLISQLI